MPWVPWVPWIQIEKEDSTKEDVKQLYKKTRNSVTGKISDLTRTAFHIDR